MRRSDGSLLGRRRLSSDGRSLDTSPLADDLLHGDALSHALERVLTLEHLELGGRVLIQELDNGQVATAHLDQDLAALDLDTDALGAKLIDTIGLTHEHDLELVAIGIVVDVLSKLGVDGVRLDGDVDGDASLEVDDVGLESLNLDFQDLHLFEQLQAGLVGLEALVLDALDVGGGGLELALQLVLVLKERLILAFEGVVFLNKHINVSLLSIAHLFKLCNVRRLFCPHLFQLRDIGSLLDAHLFESDDAIIGSGQLLLKHGHIRLAALGDATLASQLGLHCVQMVRVDSVLGVAASLVLLRSPNHTTLCRLLRCLNHSSSSGDVSRLLDGSLLGRGSLSALLGRAGLAQSNVLLQNLFQLHSSLVILF